MQAVANEIYATPGNVSVFVPMHSWCEELQSTALCIDSDGLFRPTAAMIDPKTRTGVLRQDDFVAVNFECHSVYSHGDSRYNVYGSGSDQLFPVPVVHHEMNNFVSRAACLQSPLRVTLTSLSLCGRGHSRAWRISSTRQRQP